MSPLFRRGQVRPCYLLPVQGHEQAHDPSTRRPVLLVSSDRYMAARRLAIVMPLTSSDRLSPPLALELPELATATATRRFVLPGQIRALDLGRLGPVLGTVAEARVEECLDALLALCDRF